MTCSGLLGFARPGRPRLERGGISREVRRRAPHTDAARRGPPSPTRSASPSPASPGSSPGSVAWTRATGDSASSSVTTSVRTGPGESCSAATFGHFGQLGSFLWVDPVSRVIGLVVVTDRPFRELGEEGLARDRRRRRRGTVGPLGAPARYAFAHVERHDEDVVKGVLLAGGTGSRLHPLTRITNKHLLPIYDRPMIAYGIEALVKAGISEIMVVTGGTHAGEFLRLLSNGEDTAWGCFTYAYQDRPGGIAEALGLAERFVGDDLVLVMLADNIFGRTIRPTVERFREQGKGARIVLAPVEEPEHLRHLGVPELGEGEGPLRIVEKPSDPPLDPTA